MKTKKRKKELLKSKDELFKLIEDQFDIGFGEIRCILQNKKIYEIIVTSRERVTKEIKRNK